jgi:hypothetical protein
MRNIIAGALIGAAVGFYWSWHKTKLKAADWPREHLLVLRTLTAQLSQRVGFEMPGPRSTARRSSSSSGISCTIESVPCPQWCPRATIRHEHARNTGIVTRMIGCMSQSPW